MGKHTYLENEVSISSFGLFLLLSFSRSDARLGSSRLCNLFVFIFGGVKSSRWSRFAAHFTPCQVCLEISDLLSLPLLFFISVLMSHTRTSSTY